MLPLMAGLMGGGAVLQGIAGYFGAQSQANASRKIANMLSNAWQPVGTSTGYGTASYDPKTGMFNTALTGPTADWQSQLFQQAMAAPSEQGANMFSQGQGMINAAAGMQPINVQDLATQQYGLLSQMAAPQEQQQMGNAVARLAARGMLGSSGGAGQISGIQQAQSMADIGRQVEALTQARQAATLQEQLTGGMFSRGMDLSRFGQDLTQQELQNALQAGKLATGLYGMENQIGQIARGLGEQRLEATGMMAPYQMQANQNPWAAVVGGLGNSASEMGTMGMLTSGFGGGGMPPGYNRGYSGPAYPSYIPMP